MSTSPQAPIAWQTRRDPNLPLTGYAWIERFASAMERRGASARMTGDAIATADSHAREANRATEELFGDPDAYAHELLPRRRFPWRRWFALSGWAFCFALAVLSAVKLVGSDGPTVRLSSWWWLAVLTAVFLCYASSAASTIVGPRARTPLMLGALAICFAAALATDHGPWIDVASRTIWAVSLTAGLVQLPFLWLLRSEVVRDPRTGRAYPTELNQWITQSWLLPVVTLGYWAFALFL